MASILVAYYSRSGNTKTMAETVGDGARASGADCDVRSVTETTPDDLLQADGIVLGSPTYYGQPAAELKKLLDDSVKHHGKLTGKPGGAFSSCGVLGGGAETTVRAILDALLIHGMVIQGTAKGGHYGPICVGKPSEQALKECEELGRRVAELVEKLS